MKTTQTLATALLCAFVAWAPAHAMTKDEYKAAKDKIEADHKMDKKGCDGMKGNAKDVCQKQADGKEKTAKADLENQYEPSAKNARKAAEAKADADYAIAKEKCEDQKGDAEKSCKKDAEMSHKSAMDSAKAMKG